MDKYQFDKKEVKEHLTSIQHHIEEEMSTRLKTFNDEVIAIIITIMALEIPIPHSPVDYPGFVKAISVFLISFFVVGNFWYHLCLLYSRIERASKRLVIVDLLFLADLASLPIMTSWIIEKPSVLAVANYGLVYLIAQLIKMRLRHLTFVINVSSVLPDKATLAIAKHTSRPMRWRTILLFTLNGILIALSLVNPEITIYAYLALPILDFVLPNPQMKI